jgi:hypothetical protein
MTEPTWLDIEPNTALVERSACDLVEALDKLTLSQRQFLDALVECQYDALEARKLCRDDKGRAVSTAQLTRWLSEPEFVAATAAREKVAAQLHGVSEANVLASLSDIRRRNQGAGKDGDRLALSALELLSKAIGLFQKDEDKKQDYRPGPALVIQVMAPDGTVQICTPNTGVIPQMPLPERLVN